MTLFFAFPLKPRPNAFNISPNTFQRCRAMLNSVTAKSLEHIPPSARSSDAERKLNRNLNIVKFVSTSFSIIQQRSATFNMGVQTRPTCYIQQCWKMFNKMLKAFGQGLIAFMLILNTPSRLSICVTVRYLSRSFLVNYYSNDIAGKVTKS